jgi:diaminopimelate decarboxylase
MSCDLVGPICESADVFLQNIQMPEVKEGDLLALGTSGADGSVMASHYNDRDLPSEYCQSLNSEKLELSRKGSTFVARYAEAP